MAAKLTQEVRTSEELSPYFPFPQQKRDWRRPELQRQLRIGTGLEANDGGRFTVLAIRPDGFETYGLSRPRRLVTWDDMTRYSMAIVHQPKPGVPAPAGPRDKERGGRFTIEELKRLRAADEVVRDSRTMDMLLAVELGRQTSNTSPGIRLTVDTWRPGFLADLWQLDGKPKLVMLRLGLLVAVARLYEWMEECQGVAWTSMSFQIVRVEGDTWRYEAQFEYAPQADQNA